MITRLAIIDDHSLFRTGLMKLFNEDENFEVVCDFPDGADFVAALQLSKLEFDVILLDIKMPQLNGIDCLTQLNEILPENKTIMLSMFDDNPIIKKSLRIGARGYLLKDTEPDELFRAIKSVHHTGYYVSPELSKRIIENIQKPREIDSLSAFNPLKLSAVELEVLGYICQGLTNSEIADVVHRSKRTIEGYRQKLLDKTGSKNSPALVAWAFRKGVVE